jgi:hypothetical protein
MLVDFIGDPASNKYRQTGEQVLKDRVHNLHEEWPESDGVHFGLLLTVSRVGVTEAGR